MRNEGQGVLLDWAGIPLFLLQWFEHGSICIYCESMHSLQKLGLLLAQAFQKRQQVGHGNTTLCKCESFKPTNAANLVTLYKLCKRKSNRHCVSFLSLHQSADHQKVPRHKIQCASPISLKVWARIFTQDGQLCPRPDSGESGESGLEEKWLSFHFQENRIFAHTL